MVMASSPKSGTQHGHFGQQSHLPPPKVHSHNGAPSHPTPLVLSYPLSCPAPPQTKEANTCDASSPAFTNKHARHPSIPMEAPVRNSHPPCIPPFLLLRLLHSHLTQKKSHGKEKENTTALESHIPRTHSRHPRYRRCCPFSFHSGLDMVDGILSFHPLVHPLTHPKYASRGRRKDHWNRASEREFHHDNPAF